MRTIWLLAVLTTLASATPGGAQQANPTDPDSCKHIWEKIGLPTGNTRAPDRMMTVCHLGYITGHNNGRKTPDWVIERLSPELVTGSATREDQDFQSDPALPEHARAMPRDYDGSGFDKGHQAPAADFHGKQTFLDDTFFFSNAVPQVGAGFNRSIWRSLETHVRKLVTGDRPELYVITGPVYQASERIKITSTMDVCRLNLELAKPDRQTICPENHANRNAVCSAGVSVPAALFKIVYDPGSLSAFAVIFENMSHTGKYATGRNFEYIQGHRVGIATIEALTGHTFLTALPARKQRQIKAACTDVKFH